MLSENHFWEVTWTGEDSLTINGLVMEWGIPYGASSTAAVMLLGSRKVMLVNPNKLTVTGIRKLDYGVEGLPVPSDSLPLRRVNVRREGT